MVHLVRNSRKISRVRNEKCPSDLLIRKSHGKFSGHFSEEVMQEVWIAVDRRGTGEDKC